MGGSARDRRSQARPFCNLAVKERFFAGTHVLSLETVLSMGTPKVPFNRDVFLGRLGRSGSEITLQFVIIIVPESQRTVLQIL